MAEAVIEMPRSCSIPIQSEAAVFPPLRPRTIPAVRINPEYKSSFSVRVVFPASGWLMMANVRRFAVAVASSFCSDEAVRICGAAYHTDGGDGRVRAPVGRVTARVAKAEDTRTHQERTDE